MDPAGSEIQTTQLLLNSQQLGRRRAAGLGT